MTTRAPRWALIGKTAALVGCALLVAVVALEGSASAGAADHEGRGDAAPTLGTVVIATPALGYTVTMQGPLNASRFASDAPDPPAAARTLSTLGSISTYERVWQADGGVNQVQDLVVRFPDPVRAQAFLQAVQRSLQRGEIVSSDPLPSIPDARRVTYFAAANQNGVGQAITMRAGVYVDFLSIFSAATGQAHPISPADAERLVAAQHAVIARAPGGTTPSGARTDRSKKGASAGTIGLAVVVVAIVAAAVAAPGLLRRRRLGQEAAAASPPQHPAAPPASAGDTVDDRREHRG
jgi:hypothetical protein